MQAGDRLEDIEAALFAGWSEDDIALVKEDPDAC